MIQDTHQIRTYQDEDLPGVLQLLAKELHADPISDDTFRLKVLHDPNFRPEGAFIAEVNGEVVGFMLGLTRKAPLEDAPPDLDRGWITLMAVDRRYHRKGIGSQLLESTIDYLKREGAKSIWVSPYAPNYFCPGIDEAAYPGAISFLRKHGFETAYRPLSMEVELPNMIVPNWVSEGEKSLTETGLIFDTLRPEYVESLLRFMLEEFPGDWQRLIRETQEQGDGGTRRNSGVEVFVAFEGDRCVGFARHEGERFGPFGVARAQRGRGIGGVLLGRCLLSMKSEGLSRAWFAWTDDNAAKLYSQFGFQETRRYSVMKIDLR